MSTDFLDGWISLEPCATEDSEHCFYDASVQGDGSGQSFFDYDGHQVLIQLRDGYHVDQVLVHPDGIDYARQPNPGFLVINQQNAEPAASPTPSPSPSPSPTTETTQVAAVPAPEAPTNPHGFDPIPAAILAAAALIASLAIVTVAALKKGTSA